MGPPTTTNTPVKEVEAVPEAIAPTDSLVTESEWKKEGFSAEEFKKLDTNGDGVVDSTELNILDVTTWNTEAAKAECENLKLANLTPLIEYIQGGKTLRGYTLASTLEDRQDNRAFLNMVVGLSKADASLMDRAICIMTVKRIRMGRPTAFADAFEPQE